MVSGSSVALTADGLRRVRDDLLALRERRARLIAELAATPADDAGGLQTELGLADRRVAELQALLARAVPLERAARAPGLVGIGSRVTVRWEGDGEETYTIVEPAEVSPRAGRISDASPVGRALVDRRVGERVAVETLGGLAWLEILAVD